MDVGEILTGVLCVNPEWKRLANHVLDEKPERRRKDERLKISYLNKVKKDLKLIMVKEDNKRF